MGSYRELDVWQKAMDLVVACYEASGDFPNFEIYGLTSQLRRAAVSFPQTSPKVGGVSTPQSSFSTYP